ncbi:MAG TPA: hypothetical protein PKC80_12165 [Burkholderiaceae bacterium]|nr:hypothetical protein [Burkholderiaceae bacterium]
MTKYKQTKPVFKTSVQAKVNEPVKSSFDWLGTAFKLSAFLLLVVYLFAYGAAVGYASYFGIPQSTLYSSPTDLLGIASETIFYITLHFLSTGDKFLHLLSVIESDIDKQFLYQSLTFGIAWFLVIIFIKNGKVINVDIKKIKDILFPNLKIQLTESKFITIIRALGYGIFANIMFFIIKTVIFASLFVCYIFILAAPTFGYFATIQHAQRDIIRPENCDNSRTRVQFIDAIEKQKSDKLADVKKDAAKPAANCVKVTFPDAKGSKTIAGRSVLAGSDYILIYETNGKATRIPLKTAVIEVADDAVLKEVVMQNEKLLANKAQ